MKPADARKIHTLDVRPLFASGGEPREKILAAIAALAPGQSLALVTPFLPSPLIEKMQADGFLVRPERRTDGSWQTFFLRG